MFLKPIFYSLTLLSLTHLTALEGNYFAKAHTFNLREIKEVQKGKSLDMTFNFGRGGYLNFVSQAHEIYFEIALGELPEEFHSFVKRVEPKMIRDSNKQLMFSFRLLGNGEMEVNQLKEKRAAGSEEPYIVAERRIFKNTHPIHINEETLQSIVKEKKVLFYTGAGLSLASGVPAMGELFDLLQLKEGEEFVLSLEQAINKPEHFAKLIRSFHDLCVYSEPTEAHKALAQIAEMKQVTIATENLDCLHEASGSKPYRVLPKELQEKRNEFDIQAFEYIICIGLSFDDRGFLGWYKEQNPAGRIISIDQKEPSYLGNEDLFLKGDLQKIIPSIAQKILE